MMASPEFIPLQNRDASRIIRGFLYQIELTIKRWIELDDASILELERGEDIDLYTELCRPEKPGCSSR